MGWNISVFSRTLSLYTGKGYVSSLFLAVSPEKETASASTAVRLFAYLDTRSSRSLRLKFTPTRALINLASCALSIVDNNNMAANRAEPSMRTHSCASQRELQRKPPDECLCCVKGESKSGSSARCGRVGFRLYVSLWSFRKDLWLWATGRK